MGKRFRRKLRETVVVIVVILLIVLVLWVVSHIPAAAILKWLKENWWPALAGFMVSTVGGWIVALFSGEDDKK